MKRIVLSEEEERQLEETFKSTMDRRLRERCQAVLMVSRGRKRKDIAQDLSVTTRTLQNWLDRWLAEGLEGLKIQWALGREPRIPDEMAEEVKEWVKGGPQSVGLDRANWTYEELAAYLWQHKGIEVKRTAMRRFCLKHQIRPYRPTYRLLRGDHEKQAVAAEELKEMKKKP